MIAREASTTNAHRAVLVAILLVAAALRFWQLQNMEFRYDSAYWAMEAQAILDGARPLLGQQVGSVSVPLHNGPLMSYLTAGVFAVAGPRPDAVAAVVAAVNVLGVWLTWVIARRLCANPWCALIAPALIAVAPWFVLYGRMLWPQSLFPGLVPLIWLIMTALLDRPSWPRGLLLGLCLGIGLQLHLSMLALAGLVVIVTVAASSARLRCLVAIGLGGVAGYAPLVAHDVTNGFQTVSTLLSLPAVHVAREPWLTHAAKAFWNFSNTLSGQALWVSKLGPPSPLPPVIDWAQGLIVTAALGGATWLLLRELAARDTRPWTARLRSPHVRLLVLTWVPVLYMAVSSTQITRHYFLVLFPLPFVLVALAADRLLQSRPGLRAGHLAVALVAVVALNLATVGYVFGWLARTGGASAYGPRLSDRSAAVSFIRDDSGGAFGADVRSTREPLPYVFLFQQTQDVTVDADAEHVGRIESAVGDRPRRLYKIVEPEYFPAAVNADAAVWRSASVVVERLQ